VATFTDEDDALLDELGVDVETKTESSRTPREERIIAGFEEIQRFVEQHGRVPQHGEDRDIFERLYAVRLDRLHEQDDCRTLLKALDHQGLLADGKPGAAETLDDDALLAELGVEGAAEADITQLKHVRSQVEKNAAEEIANRDKCLNFERFKPLFKKAESELASGARQTRPFGKDASVQVGDFFILGGQVVFVAEIGEPLRAPNGESDARLRVIYSNGTESNLLRRSLQRALYKDDAGRRLTDPNAGPLFSETSEKDDIESGTIYVLRSKSEHPVVAANREVLHKIGVTGGDVAKRIANAELDPTFLMAGVEVVATYQLFNINRTKLENVIHRVFAAAQLDVEIKDRFGNPVTPREWFLVPIFVVNEAVERIKDGTITQYVYDPKSAKMVKARTLK
jgi:hypothetical protein